MPDLSILCVNAHEPNFVMWTWRTFAAAGFLKIDIISVKDMVNKLTVCCIGGTRIRELWIAGHAGSRGQYIGADALTLETVENFRPDLARLAPLFSSGLPCPMVTLCGCNVGNNVQLELALQGIWQVSVRAYTEMQYAVLPGFQGRASVAEPLRRGPRS